MSELIFHKRLFWNKIGLGTVAHRSMGQEFSGAGQPQIPPDWDGAGDQPRAVWDPLRQYHHGGRGRVWSCRLNPRPAAAASAAAAPP